MFLDIYLHGRRKYQCKLYSDFNHRQSILLDKANNSYQLSRSQRGRKVHIFQLFHAERNRYCMISILQWLNLSINYIKRHTDHKNRQYLRQQAYNSNLFQQCTILSNHHHLLNSHHHILQWSHEQRFHKLEFVIFFYN